MKFKHLTAQQLCLRLANAWSHEHLELSAEVFDRFCDKWKATGTKKDHKPTYFCGSFDLKQVRLHGAMNVGFLVLGSTATLGQDFVDFRTASNHRLTLVIVNSEPLRELVRQSDTSNRFVVLMLKDVEELLTLPRPIEELKKRIRQQIPIRRLVPFDITHQVSPNMFFGRRELLDRFRDEDTTNFAIAGPGRIGKSSLIAQYHYELRASSDERLVRVRSIDCYPFRALSPDELAQRIALAISGTLHASKIQVHTLLRFLRWKSEDGSKPLELLFDEVDGVCLNEAFEVIGDAVKSNYCRVIFCGKGQLYRLMCRKETALSQFGHRLELITPEPLPWDVAEHLLVDPLEDLGFQIPHAASLCQAVFLQTNRRPHLIQAYARLLVEAAVRLSKKAITAELVEEIRSEFQSRFFSSIPLEDFQDDKTRLIALLMLRAGSHAGHQITVAYTQTLASSNGLSLTASQVLAILDDLWICNVITRTKEHATFEIANPHLVEFVRRMDFSNEITRLKKCCVPA